MIKKVHHIGIAVRNIQESAALFKRLLGVKPDFEDAPCQRVTEAVFKLDSGTEIDLLEPTGPESAVAKFLERHGEGLHHIALETDDLAADLKNVVARGFQLIDTEGRDGVAGQIAFLHPRSVNSVLVELVQPRDKGEKKP